MRFFTTKNLLNFGRDQRGVASIEFGFIAPILIFVLVSILAASDAASANRNLTNASATVSDLATRVIEMTDERSDAILKTGVALMGKHGHSAAKPIVTMANVSNTLGDDKDVLNVTWSTSNKAGKEITNADLKNLTFPEIPDGESVILVRVNLTYIPTYASSAFGVMEMEKISVRRPRFVIEVPYTKPKP